MSEADMVESQRRKVDAEIAKLIAETAKINAEARFYPLIVVGGILAAVATILKLFASG